MATVSLDDVHMHSEQEKMEEKGMPIVAVKDKTKLMIAKVVPSECVQEFAAEVVRKFVE